MEVKTVQLKGKIINDIKTNFFTFFHVVVFRGNTIAQWMKQGLQDDPEYDYFKEFLEYPLEEARALVDDRVPVPMYKVCNEGQGDGRYLLHRLNPSVTHNTPNGYHDESKPQVFTDDVSLSVFMDHLKRLAVQ